MKAPTWHSETLPEVKTPSPAGWLRLVLRVLALLTVIGVGLVVLGLLRLVERPIWGAHRPITPYVTQAVCRVGLIILGLRLKVSGRPMARAGALVSNHISWIDVFAINATTRVCFVAKSEVAGWPGIGLLARVTGTAFVKREAAEAGTQRDLLRQRIRDGFLLAFFPEGTTTDGLQVLPFKSALFAAFTDMPACAAIQPLTLRYVAPPGADARHYGWWGDMALAEHFRTVLSHSGRGSVILTYHPPLARDLLKDRKAMARTAEAMVRNGLHEPTP
ncbi:MAG: 1-acyl-sn-glycerol-3-phosphate acyltransferase [Rhodobacteraceae bacterium]|nr:1-acyl-sn-glycerol-3-phosphate acyltransferase [Paracoccaceae bacterium]